MLLVALVQARRYPVDAANARYTCAEIVCSLSAVVLHTPSYEKAHTFLPGINGSAGLISRQSCYDYPLGCIEAKPGIDRCIRTGDSAISSIHSLSRLPLPNSRRRVSPTGFRVPAVAGLLLVLLGSFFVALARAQDKSETPSLSMFIWSQRLEPIIYSHAETASIAPLESYDGIVVDVLDSFVRDNDLELNVVVTSRKRGELDLYENRLDFTILAPAWLDQPENLLFSDPIYTHREFLYGLEPIVAASLEEAVSNKRICVRFGYKFGTVQKYFDAGVATRVDSREELFAFKMLEYGRCDFVLTNEFVADAIIEANELEDQIYVSPFLVDEAAFTFAFHPTHAELVDRLNEHIEGLRGNGMLASSITKHRRKAVGFAHLLDKGVPQ